MLKKAGHVITAPVTKPIEQAKNAGAVLTGKKSLEEGLKAAVKTEVKPTEQAAQLTAEVHHEVSNGLTEATKEVAGKDAATLVDIGTAPARYGTELGTTVVVTGARIAQGHNLGEIVSAPLAAAIRAAREQHIGSAKPIPAHIKAQLAGVFPAKVLAAARYTVGDVRLALPDGIKIALTFVD